MPSYHQTYKMENLTCVLEFLEALDDKFDFPKIQPSIRRIEVDLDKVGYMSSFGVKRWIEWWRSNPPDAKYVITRARPSIVNNAGMMEGFLPRMTAVESLYAPYISEDGETDKQVLLKLNEHYFDGGALKLPTVAGDDGAALEEDFLPDKYFKFLKRT